MDKIVETSFTDALNERYLAYALSTIMSRSLPDVRDGLKPVHRRILYAMLQLKLDPKSAYKKCARVVGDVIGKYHPHGDVAVYDALVRLAQDFTIRYPLIDGQGNFGSIDGDNAAAMRYTESRLTEVALYLLKDIEEDTVRFKSTYDEQDQEPCLLPASFPNLLANGTEGIAVGMATSIPPHNIYELCEACLALLSNENKSISDLLEFIQGPDLPTGGIINESKESILKSYETGKGSFKVRALWHVEELPRKNYQIVITEIPYQVQKSKLIERIAELYKLKKLPLIDDFYDDSAESIAIIVKPKNSEIAAETVMESLFKLTDLEYRINLNLNVLDSNSIPRVMNLKEVLIEFLNHRKIIVVKRSEYRLEKVKNRLELLEGFLIAYLNLDEIIRIIRYEDEPKEELIKKFNLSEMQAEAILNMRLKSLRKLEEQEIKKEHAELTKTKADLEDIINNPESLKKVIKQELNEVKKKFAYDSILGARRTKIDNELALQNTEISIEAYVAKEPITIICSQMGWIKAIKGHDLNPDSFRYKDGDGAKYILEVYTTDKILLFTSTGKFYTLLAHTVSLTKGDGDPINILFDFEKDEQIIEMLNYAIDNEILLVSKNGKGFIVNSQEVLAQTKLGKKVMNLTNKDEAKFCYKLENHSEVLALLGSNRKLLIIKTEDIARMKKGQGTQLMKLPANSFLVSIKLFNLNDGLKWSYLGQIRTETRLNPWLGKRGSSGKIPPAGLGKNNSL